LKSLLYYLGARRVALLTHSVVEMVHEAQKKEKRFEDLMDDARELDLHYIPSRYPNGLPSGYPHQFYGRETAARALKAGEAIVNTVKDYYQRLGEDGFIWFVWFLGSSGLSGLSVRWYVNRSVG